MASLSKDLCLCEGSPHPFLVYKHWERRPRDGKSPEGEKKKKKEKKSEHWVILQGRMALVIKYREALVTAEFPV